MTVWTAHVQALRYALRCERLRRGLWAALGLALLVLALLLLGWWPVWREHLALSTKIDAQRQAVRQARHLREAVRAQQHLQPRLAALERKLQTPVSQAELIAGLARLAARRGVRVQAQAFEAGRAQGSGAAPLYLELGLQGDYRGLRGLMADLSELPPWVELIEVKFEPVAAGSRQLRAQWRLAVVGGAGGRKRP